MDEGDRQSDLTAVVSYLGSSNLFNTYQYIYNLIDKSMPY